MLITQTVLTCERQRKERKKEKGKVLSRKRKEESVFFRVKRNEERGKKGRKKKEKYCERKENRNQYF